MNDAPFGVYNAPLSDMGATEALIAWGAALGILRAAGGIREITISLPNTIKSRSVQVHRAAFYGPIALSTVGTGCAFPLFKL